MGAQLPENVDELSFEQAMNALEDVVAQMEAADLSLEETLKLFERGTRLVQRCNTLLEQAELRVIELTQAIEKKPADLPPGAKS